MKDRELLKFVHDRLVNFYLENFESEYLHRLRNIIGITPENTSTSLIYEFKNTKEFDDYISRVPCAGIYNVDAYANSINAAEILPGNVHLKRPVVNGAAPDEIPNTKKSTEDAPTPPSALSRQVGGSHYKDCKIQPIEMIEANDVKFLEGCVIKRVLRHNKSTGKGLIDIEKAIHELELIKEFRYNAGKGEQKDG